MSTQEQKLQKVIYPDQLNIIIRTSVPGYQKIEYKPSMTIKDSDEKSVKFNPLIKLHQSTIDKIPQEYRIKEFFNKGLFQSLLNYNGGTPAKNLVQATRYGYVDNNINVTLNSIFPTGSVIYIGKTPYVIADHQWTTGDWKIEIKQKKQQIDPNKVVDPQLYTQLVKDEIISGEEQLNQLPESIIVGNNYSGPPVAQGKKTSTAAAPSIGPTGPPPPSEVIVRQPIGPTGPPPSGVIVRQPIPIGPTGPPPSGVIVRQPIAPTGPPAPLAITKPIAPTEPTEAEEVSPEEVRIFETFLQDVKFNIKNTKFFRDYFKTNSYKIIATSIFNSFPLDVRKAAKGFYSYVTNSEPRIKKEGLSNQLYEKLCDQVSIIKSPQDGDCFFKAVSDGINIYNYENPDSKIYRGNYGKTLLYTTTFMRGLVRDYVENLGEEIINNMLVIAEEQVEVLNMTFSESIEGLKNNLGVTELTSEQYVSELDNTYFSNSNFLIYNPGRIPLNVDDYNTPFRVLKRGEVLPYIMSKNYWANDIAIEAICSLLNICIIPIEKYEYQRTSGKVRIKTTMVDRLKALLLNRDLTNEQCSSKIMFLLYENNHYELIRFTYFVKPITKMFGEGIRKQIIYEKKWFTIFQKRDLSPPFHILLLIYATIYSTINESSKAEFNIFKPLMENIHASVYKVLKSPYREVFKTTFNDIFPNKILIDKRVRLSVKGQEEEKEEKEEKNNGQKLLPAPNRYSQLDTLDGGGPNYQYSSNYRQPYSYSRPFNITKKPDEVDSPKIAYAITIDMEVHPGTSLTPEQLSQSKCNSKYNAIKKAFSEFTGRPYVIPPVYHESKNTTKKKLVQTKGGRRKTRKNL